MNKWRTLSLLLILVTATPLLHCWEISESLKNYFTFDRVKKIAFGFPFCSVNEKRVRYKGMPRTETKYRVPWSKYPLHWLTIYSRTTTADPLTPTKIKTDTKKWHYKNIARLAVVAGTVGATVGGSIYAWKNWDSISSRLHELNPCSNS